MNEEERAREGHTRIYARHQTYRESGIFHGTKEYVR